MKKTLTIILTLSMLLGLVGILPISASGTSPEVWDGSIASSFAGGSGTSADPYRISTGAELALMSKLITVDNDGNYNRAHYVLTADIVLNDMPHVSTWYDGWVNDANDAYVPENMFTPIGTWSNATSSFGGTFDGDGHTITGAYFYSTTGDNHGLFGAIQGGAVIKNLALTNSLFGNEVGNIAAIVGTTDRENEGNILIENIYVDAYVYGGGDNVGGIIGTLSNTQDGYDAGKVTIRNVTFTGNVEGKNFVAGLVADARNVVFDIDDCLVFADIYASVTPSKNANAHAAGFVARSNNNLSLISEYDQVITNCILAGGSVKCSKDNSYDYPMAYVSSRNGTSKILAEYCYNAISGLSTMRNADTADDDAPSADISVAVLYGNYENDSDVKWNLLTNWARPTYDIARPKGVAEGFEIAPIALFENGSGTADDPFRIANAQDLAKLSKNTQSNTYEGVYFILTNDIALTGENNHTPIGSWSYGFGGTFDGNGYTISGVHIKNTGDGSGFFACIQGGAVIKNLALTDAYVESTDKGAVGALVGQTNRANSKDVTIQNVYVDAEVIVANGDEVSGIIGNLSESKNDYVAGSVNISDTVFTGSVTSVGDYCAGFVGDARSVTVNLANCANYGKVTTDGSYAAGLVSTQSGAYAITNCIVAGEVTGAEDSTYAIACAKSSSEGSRAVASTYYVTGIARDSMINFADENATANITPLASKSTLIGESATEIDGWTKRTYDYLVPNGVANFAPQKDAATYIIRWENHDGTLLCEEEYEYGVLPEYKGNEPTKDEDDKYYYRFNGWDPKIEIASEDVTYTALFYKERKPAETTPDEGDDTESDDITDTEEGGDTEKGTESDVIEDTDTEEDVNSETESEVESESETEQTEVKEKSFFGKIFDAIFNFFKGIINAIFGKKE